MKEIILLLFFTFSSVVSATTYYVATTGNDSNPGTISQPWATWQKAFSIATAGDTVYFRGGIYMPTTSNYGNIVMYYPHDTGHNGNPGNPVCFFNYPGEKPILDCSLVDPIGNYNTGISIFYGDYVHLRGLTVRNIRQVRDGVSCCGIGATWCSNLTYENCEVYNVGGEGISVLSGFGYNTYRTILSDTTSFINCDVHNCCDSFIDNLEAPGFVGGWADGFKVDNEIGACFRWKGCRVWNCSDDGYDISGSATGIFENCWSFANGRLNGDGNGFKYGGVRNDDIPLARSITNCLSAYNRATGFNENNNGSYQMNLHIFNNTAFKNETGYINMYGVIGEPNQNIYRNNIAYRNTLYPMAFLSPTIDDHNTWGSVHPFPSYTETIQVTDADFISVDSTGITGPRQSDGSLPNLGFLKLALTSDLIDAGIDVGLPYNPPYPDLGAFEYSGTNPNLKPVTSITVTGAGGAKIINTDNGTLQLSTVVLPADATNKAVTWSISSGTDKASISSAGLVTAIDNGTTTARATATDGSGVYGILTITISNQVIPVSNITVTGAGGATTVTTDNGTIQLNAMILPANATNKTLTWSISSGADKASISSTGLVTALDNGTVTARATATDGSGVYGTLTITISNQVIPVSNITITGAGGSTTITTDNGTLQLNAAVLPANATNKTLIWSISSGTDKASISSAGLVTALDNGTVTARATANDGSGVYGTLTITISNQVISVTSIIVTGEGGKSLINAIGGTLQLNASILPANATNKTLTWSISSGTDKASISSVGLVTALDNGTVTARATANDGSGVYGTLTITISDQVIAVSNITVTGAGGATTITTYNGTLQLSAAILPVNATNKTVTWSISNGADKASINSTGLVTAIDNGTVIVKATANDGSGIYGTIVIIISNNVNSPPVIIVNYKSSSYSGFVYELDASKSYDSNKDNLTFTWQTSSNISVSSTTGSNIKYLSPAVSTAQTYEFTLIVSDGKTTQSKVIPIEIIPYRPELEVAEISDIKASSFQPPYYPYNIIDGNIGTMWSSDGDNQWLIIELKHSYAIQHIKLAFQPGQRSESYFDILGSADKLSWEPIMDKAASCGFSGDLQVFDFPPSKTGKEFDYVKIVGHGNSADTWNYISELKIFGYMHRNSVAYETLPVKVYPNPAKEFVTMRIDESTLMPDFIQINEITGAVIMRDKVDPNIREFTIPINLKNGVYILQLGSGKLTLFTQKLVISR
jgi:uncharacterized protein YjdB